MKLRGVNFNWKTIIALSLYYGFAYYLPMSNKFFGIGGKIRRVLCKQIFLKMGHNVNVEKHACFGSGRGIVIGDNSGLGVNCLVPSNTIIGDNVMMGPNCYIFTSNHDFSRTDIPMIRQGFTEKKQTIIGNDVWIGRNVSMTPGRYIADGTIIGACCMLTKDFPEYSVVGGNPSRLIRLRK